MNNHGLTIAICTHNRADDVFECLTALKPQLENFGAEVIVVDSGSSAKHASTLLNSVAEFPFARLIRLEQPGVSRARNTAVSVCSTPWIAFVDDDAIPAADWLATAIRLANSVPPNCAIIGGTVFPIFRDGVARTLSARTAQMLSITKQKGEADQTETAQVVGANMMFRKSTLVQAGGFDEGLGRVGAHLLSGEEKMLQERLVLMGFRIWCSDRLIVGHKISSERLNAAWFERRAYWDGVSDRRIARLLNHQKVGQKTLKICGSLAGLAPLKAIAPAHYEFPIRYQYNLGWMRESLNQLKISVCSSGQFASNVPVSKKHG